MCKGREAESAAARRGAVRRGGRRGIALVAVLWALVLLSVIAAGFLLETRTETKLARNLVENAEAEALADAGVHRAILEMSRPPARPEPLRRGGPPAEQRWRADGTVYAWAFGGGEVRISIADEGGKIDLNRAPDELLEGLFVVVGVEAQDAARLVAAVADFRDEDDVKRPDGAEDDDYRAAGLAWEAKDRPFEAVEELLRVMGMTRELYEKLAPFLTVHAKRPRLDMTTAPREVLLAVPGVDAAEVEALLEARAAIEGPIGREPLPLLSGVRGYFSLSNKRVFTVRAEARTQGGAVFVREAIVGLTGRGDPPFRFLVWRQGRLVDAAGPAE